MISVPCPDSLTVRFIIQNWDESEFGKKYDLIYDEGELKSQQFRTDIGRIDILAKDIWVGLQIN